MTAERPSERARTERDQTTEYDYDLLVIGSGPGGQKAAIAAAKLGRRAAVVERRQMVGGVCINTGTIPSKTLREAVIYLTGLNMRDLYGASYRVKSNITVQDLLSRTQHVIGREIEIIRSQLFRNHVELLHGMASFVDDHTVAVCAPDGRVEREVTAEHIVVATGTKPARPDSVDFDEKRVVDSDGILNLERDPRLDGRGRRRRHRHRVRVDVRCTRHAGDRDRAARQRMIDFCDDEIVEALKFHLRDLSVTFRIGEKVAKVESNERGTVTTLESGKKIPADTVMYSAGRQGMTEPLKLENAGLDRGQSRPHQGRHGLPHRGRSHLGGG